MIVWFWGRIFFYGYVKIVKHPLSLWKHATALVWLVWLCARLTRQDIYTNHYWTTI